MAVGSTVFVFCERRGNGSPGIWPISTIVRTTRTRAINRQKVGRSGKMGPFWILDFGKKFHGWFLVSDKKSASDKKERRGRESDGEGVPCNFEEKEKMAI